MAAPMNTLFLKLGWKSTWRDLRAGELRLLIVAVTLAVASLTAVGFFADRLKGGLERDARQLLGGDVIVNSDQPTPAAFIGKAVALGLRTSSQLSFPTMARARDEDGGASKLVAFKAVADGYPLRGNLRLADEPGLPGALTREVPAPGTVWVEAPLLDALGLTMGQPLQLGDAQFTVRKIIVSEPDRGGGFISFSPRVMVNQADVAATALSKADKSATRLKNFSARSSVWLSSGRPDWVDSMRTPRRCSACGGASLAAPAELAPPPACPLICALPQATKRATAASSPARARR